MIIDKLPLPSDPTPAEAPPSYETIRIEASSFSDEKSASPGASSAVFPPQVGQSITSQSGKSPRPAASVKGKGGLPNWLNFAATRAANEVHNTVLSLVRDLVRQQTPEPASLGVLTSCADACASYGLSLSSLLQEASIEGHTPLFWAIVKRGSDGAAEGVDLVTALLTMSAPLTPATVAEARHACLLTSDQALFQRLRLLPEFMPRSGTDEMLLGTHGQADGVEVKDIPGDEGAFVVEFTITEFQKRMRISEAVVLEFIARGRMWRLQFLVASGGSRRDHTSGSWYLSLSLLEHSPPTWIDSRLLIEEPHPLEPVASLIDAPVPSPTPSRPGRVFTVSPRTKPKPTISLRLTSKVQLAPLVPALTPREAFQTEINVPLDTSMMGPSLQYAGSSYIAADGLLRARLEARLAKPETECVIC